MLRVHFVSFAKQMISYIAKSCCRPNVFGSNLEYKRFVIVANQRTGSTMLVSALGQHPAICCYSEVLNQALPMFYVDGLNNHSWLLNKYQKTDPVGFVRDFIFRGYSELIQAVGFKVFPAHLQLEQNLGVSKWLSKTMKCAIIRLKRRNHLATLVSLERAKATGIWSAHSNDEVEPFKLRLLPDRCVEAFERFEKEDRYLDQMFAEQLTYTVEYEQLRSSSLRVFNELQGVLDVPVRDITSPLRRQNPYPMSYTLENYGELESHFRRTKWSSFFQEK